MTKALQAALQSRLQKTNTSQLLSLRSFNQAFLADVRYKSPSRDMHPQQRKVTLECNGPGNDPTLGLCLFLLQYQVIPTNPKTIKIKFPSKFLFIEL